MCSFRVLAVFSCGLALASASSRVTAQDSACNLPPAEPFNAFLLNSLGSTYNPYSSKDNEVANINHEPKAPGEKGHWISKSYKVSCGADSGLFKQTYLNAVVGTQAEGGICSGTYLHISNSSPKYPAYFGVDGLLNDSLEPKQTKVIHLPRYAPGTGAKPAVVANVYVKYWDDEGGQLSTAAANSVHCNTVEAYLRYRAHQDDTPEYIAIRQTFQWPRGTVTVSGTWSMLTPQYGVLRGSRFINNTSRTILIEECWTDTNGHPFCSVVEFPPSSELKVSVDVSRYATFKVWVE